jgi:hypothetical protein
MSEQIGFRRQASQGTTFHHDVKAVYVTMCQSRRDNVSEQA